MDTLTRDNLQRLGVLTLKLQIEHVLLQWLVLPKEKNTTEQNTDLIITSVRREKKHEGYSVTFSDKLTTEFSFPSIMKSCHCHSTQTQRTRFHVRFFFKMLSAVILCTAETDAIAVVTKAPTPR